MMRKLRYPLVCVVGPTASGKTALAQHLAERLGACVLSADSMQVYRGMDIGTGKIPPSERTVAYYGLDLVDPGQAYSAALFQTYGRDVVERVDDSGGRCVVCGGTGFYIRALVDCFDFPPGDQTDNPVRDRYMILSAEEGPQAVWDELHSLDPQSAAIIPVNDTKRVVRALEMHFEGVSYAQQKDAFSKVEPYYPVCMIGLSVSPPLLAQRIEKRVDGMVAEGLVEEVKSLIENGYRDAITANQAIGYKEIVACLDGACSLDEAIEQIKTATRQYAKRQRTWFRKDERIAWIDADDNDVEALGTQALNIIGQEEVLA